MDHACQDFKGFESYLEKLHHAHRDVDDAAYKLQAISRPPSGSRGHRHGYGHGALYRGRSHASS